MKIRQKLKKIVSGVMSAFTFVGAMSLPIVTTTAEASGGLDVGTAFSQVVGSHTGQGNWHYSYNGGNYFGTIMSDDNASADTYYNIGLDCTAGTVAVVARAIKNSGGSPRDYFGMLEGALNEKYPPALISYFQSNGKWTQVSSGYVDASQLQPGDILIYGTGSQAGHMSIYAGNNLTIDFTSGGAGRETYSGYARTDLAYSDGGTSTSGSYPLSAIFRANLNKDISVSVIKKSSCTNVSDNNPLYSDLSATFGVYLTQTDATNDTNRKATITTNAEGTSTAATMTVSGDTNTVYVKEIQAPKYFNLNTTVFSVDVSSGSGVVTIEDEPITDPAEITVIKKDIEDKSKVQSLAGAEFTFKYYAIDPNQTYTAEQLANTTATRTWTFKTIESGNTGVLNIKNTDCVVTDKSDALYYSTNGDITIPMGVLTIQETKAATGYTVEGGYLNSVDGSIQAGANETLVFNVTGPGSIANILAGNPNTTKNEAPIRGGIEVTKVDSVTGRREQNKSSFAGAEFDIVYVDNKDQPNQGITVRMDTNNDGLINSDDTEYKPGDTVGHIVLDENGYYKSSANYLSYGSYKLVETKAPEGMSLMASDIEFEVNDNSVFVPLTVTDAVYLGNLSIHKVYSKTGSSWSSNEEGAVFDVVAAKYVEQYAADSNNITRQDVINAYNHRNDWTGTDVDGNAITGYTDAEYDQLITDASGIAYSKQLAYGNYYMVQESGKANYDVVQDVATFVVVSENQATIEYQASNNPTPFTLKMLKKDSATGEMISLTSAAFKVKKLTDADGKDVSNVTSTSLGLENGYVTQTLGDGDDKTTYNVFKTVSRDQADNNNELEEGMFYPANSKANYDATGGEAVVPLTLEAGTYRLEEVVTPDGFTTGQSFEFTISDGNITRINSLGQNIIEVTMYDQPLMGTIHIKKTIDSYVDADTSLLDMKDLSGFGFTLTAAEDIISPDDGSVIVAAGEKAVVYDSSSETHFSTLDELFTDAEGNLTIENLPLGKYTLAETTQPKGTVTNTHAYEVVIEQSAFDKTVDAKDITASDVKVTIDGVEVSEVEPFTIENKVTKTELTKDDATTSKELPGAEIEVRDGDTVVDKWTSTEKSHKIEGLEFGKTYTMVETATVDGYYYSEDIEFTVEEEMTKVEMHDNVIKYEIAKVDDKNGDYVEGVTLKLVDVTDKDNPVEVELPNKGVTTDKPFELIGILKAEHKYELTESEYVAGVYKVSDAIEFTVPKTGSADAITTVTMVDETTNIAVRKVDNYGNPVAGAKMQIIEAELEAGAETTENETIKDETAIDDDAYLADEETDEIANYDDEIMPLNETSEEKAVVDETDESEETSKEEVTENEATKQDETDSIDDEYTISDSELKYVPVKDEDGNDKVVYEFTTTDDVAGVDISQYVKGDGTYILREVEAPFGFTKIEDQVFTVTGKLDSPQTVMAIDNRDTYYVSAVKVDKADHTKLLKGAEITLFNADGTVAKDINGKECKGLTDGEGVITWNVEYSDDNYYVQETDAPLGYKINENHYEVELSSDFFESEEKAYQIVVEDEIKAVQMGAGMATGIAAMGIASLTGLGVLAGTKKKKKEEE